ncbi:hypothetical protein [Glycomyces rhizosphaerae]|uniref:Uncharacterized protein n=1 Tax=Glycomyces rhizosphaerae TaxID=2054422 RepID=A0ABV7Q5J7_9ACTN
MKPPPTPTVRRAIIAAVWLTVVFGGLLAAVWGVAWALKGGPQPSVETVAQATHLAFPEGTDVVESDLSAMQSPTPGARAEVTVDIPSDEFDDFIADNAMEAPLLAGTTPSGSATGIIPAACNDEVCYSATIVVEKDAVTVNLDVTLL